uniref:Prophage lp2 protein 33 n=1 Tax=Edwardsiella phage eiDWF TaxID=945084 RepID=E7EKY1_9VIRU|nr:prophage lp2 protein 33 [Edwardsiella phage eiDWF]
MPTLFVKKPVKIEAKRFTYPPSAGFLEWCGGAVKNIRKQRHPGAVAFCDVVTLEDGPDKRARHVATEGDYIIKGVKGEFYPCKPDIFHITYDPVEE